MVNKNRKFNIICRNIYTICKYIKSLPNILSYMNFGQIYPSYDIDNSEHKKLFSSTHSYLDITPTPTTNVITKTEQIYNSGINHNWCIESKTQNIASNQEIFSRPDDIEQTNSLANSNTNNIKLRINLKACQTISSNDMGDLKNSNKSNNHDLTDDDNEYDIID